EALENLTSMAVFLLSGFQYREGGRRKVPIKCVPSEGDYKTLCIPRGGAACHLNLDHILES
ncbi:MAG: hypothetical protein MK294_06550, partial [Rhodospirillales bacterium]|nr:hypothetical protein [Rhodospirillales bacterium]